MLPHPDGPESFCYDAIEPRAFTWASFSQLAVVRSLEVEYSFFDSNPACAATCIVGTQSFEAFLESGPDPSVPATTQTEVRDYLVSTRTPGPSTWVSVNFESLLAATATPAASACAVWWALVAEGAGCPHPGFPGPSYAGYFDEQPGAARSALRRLLVAPGPHTVIARVAVRYLAHDAMTVSIETLQATLDVVVAAGEHRALSCGVDLDGRCATLVDDGAWVRPTAG